MRLALLVGLLLPHAAGYLVHGIARLPIAPRAPCISMEEAAAAAEDDVSVTITPPEPAEEVPAPVEEAPAPVFGVLDPVFTLKSPEQFTSLRIGGIEKPPTYAEVKAALLAIPEEDEEAMAEFMAVNRDLLDYRFLYMLTSERLRAINTGNQAEAATLEAARRKAVKAAQAFDTPLFGQVAEAEGRLGGLLAQYMQGKTPDADMVAQATGSTPSAIFAFWMVLIAAVAAWEVKLPVESAAAQAKEKIGQLTEIRTILEGNSDIMGIGYVHPVQQLMSTADMIDPQTGKMRTDADANVKESQALLTSLSPDRLDQILTIRRLGCLYCQAQRHGFQAYNPMVQRTAALYDVLMHGKPQPLAAVDIKSPIREYTSTMTKMSQQAEGILRDQGVEIPLFW